MKKQEIRLEHKRFVLGDKPFFLYSGEVHYFRIPRKDWKDRLKKAKATGLNTISSYVPWCWHEFEEGSFDFTGKTHPERDLVGFINLVREFGLYFLARVGPVSNAELVNEGLPGWLLKEHSEVYTEGKGLSDLPHVTLVSYLNPTFQMYVKRWYENLSPIIARNQVTQGGNIILVQLCNEIGMAHWVNKTADYSRTATQLYQDFLRRNYGEIGRLNMNYGTDYREFNQIEQPDGYADSGWKPVFWDWAQFYRWYHATYYQSLTQLARTHKITVPVVANIPQFYDFDVRGRGIYSPMTTSMFRDFPLYVPDVIFGGAYQPRRLDFDNFHDIVLTTDVMKMVSSPDVPTICCELQTGILRDRPRIQPADVELLLKASVSQGLNGVNSYLFCGGTNPEGLGVFGSYHDWQAPISPEGKERPHLEPLKSFGRFIKTFGEKLALTEKEFDTVFGIYAPYYATEYLKGKFTEELERKRDQLFFDGMARLLQLAGINFSLKDLQRSSIEELLSHPTLWVFCLDFMDGETQMKLVQYVEKGGRLIIFPTLPTTDLSCQKKTLLLDGLGIEISGRVRENLVKVKGKEILVRGETTVFRSPESSARILARTFEGEPCGLLTKKGKGRALILGFGITHVFDYHIELAKSFVREMAISPSIVVEPGGVMATVRSRAQGVNNSRYGFLFLSNYKDEPENVKISLRLPGEKRRTTLPERGSMYLPGRTVSILPLNVPLSEEIKIKWSSVEILEYKVGKPVTLLVQKAGGGDSEIVLSFVGVTRRFTPMYRGGHPKRPRIVRIDGKMVPFKYIDGLLKIHFKPNGKLQNLTIQL